MSLVLTGLWPALVMASILGAVAGWLSGLPRDRTGRAVAGSLTLLLLVLAGLALSQRVPGASGFWVETASLLLGCYLAGCLAGAFGSTASHRKA